MAIGLVFKALFKHVRHYDRKAAILSDNVPLIWFHVSISLSFSWDAKGRVSAKMQLGRELCLFKGSVDPILIEQR